MLGTLTFALLASAGQQQQIEVPDVRVGRELKLTSADKKLSILLIQAYTSKMDRPKRSPLNDWVFEYVTNGYTRETENEGYNIRIRVFNQFRATEGDVTDYAARMLLRLWDFNRWRMNSDHGHIFNLRTVDLYLCFGGEPGGQQVLIEDHDELDNNGNPFRANNIYIYAITSLTDKLEFAREIAHEYGHATWPAIGGFTKPEQWANGDMGERVFLMWMLQEIEKGTLGRDDMMQARVEDLRVMYKNRILPDMERVATRGPDIGLLAKGDEKAYSELLGLTTYAAAIMPHRMFGRAIHLNPNRTAAGLAKGVLDAADEAQTWNVTVPNGLQGQAIWLPVRAGTVSGAKELRRQGDWVKVQPTSGVIKVTNKPKS